MILDASGAVELESSIQQIEHNYDDGAISNSQLNLDTIIEHEQSYQLMGTGMTFSDVRVETLE